MVSEPPPFSGASGLRPSTLAVTAGRPDGVGRPLNTPIVAASNFVFDPVNDGGRQYSRGDATPTWESLEAAMGALEGGVAVAFASGMAAISAVLDPLPTGALIVAPDDCYQGVAAVLDRGVADRGWTVERHPTADTDSWLATLERRPTLLWVESPSNPLLAVADVPTLCAAATRAGVPVAVDNTFATPLLQRPLTAGATYSIHSATKFIGGHSDLLGGVVVCGGPDPESAAAAVKQRRLLGGATMGALEAFLALRGLRTLDLRLQRSQAGAGELAARLEAHRAVTAVRYPALASHPDHERAAHVLDGPGSMVSFETTGSAAALDRALRGLTLIRSATSLGGVESTIERRQRLPGQETIPPTLLRLSVGCEHVEDLWDDLDALLARL